MKNEIYEEMKKLKLEFYKIQCKNWIKGNGSSFKSIGETFEELLHKSKDNDILPDYNGIELKTKAEKSQPYMGLFSMALDNRPLRMKKLYELCGYPSRKNKNYKVFYAKIFANKKTNIGYRFSFQLNVNFELKIIQLLIYDYHTLLNEDMSWSFAELKNRLEHKLTYLAKINAKKDKIDNQIYFKFTQINFYKLKNFKTFLNLIDNGKIRVNIKLSFHEKGNLLGEIYDKGTTWEIKEDDIEKLFQKIIFKD